MAWRVAKSLLALRDEIDAAYPQRSKASDGTIGDAAHQSQGSASDHNPWLTLYGDPTGIVTALDVTHDPAHGCDIDALTDRLAASRDARIKYLIANGLILSGNDGPSPWVWRAYGGSDPHTNHFHLSVVADPRCDDTRPWGITGVAPSTGGDDLNADQDKKLADIHYTLTHLGAGGTAGALHAGWPGLTADVKAARAAAEAANAKLATIQTGGQPTQAQVDSAVLAAMLDPRVQKGIGDAVASHIHVS